MLDMLLAAIKLLKRKNALFLKSCKVKRDVDLAPQNYAYYHGVETCILRLQTLHNIRKEQNA